MALRFSSLEAMKAALGSRARVRDSFAPSARPPDQNQAKLGRSSPKRAPRAGYAPHDILWEALRRTCADAVREYEGAVPGRKYRLDIAIPAARLAVEVDGWEWHGKHKGDFTRDRERQNLLTLHGWRILRFTAGQIRSDVAGCVEMIKQASMGGRSMAE